MSDLTKRAMASALRERLTKGTLDNVTVKDITDDCGLNRQTFYYHFKDIYDLMEWMFTEEARKVLQEDYNSTDLRNVDVKEMLERTFDYLLKNEKFILNSYHSVTKNIMDSFLRSWIEPILTSIIEQKAEGRTIAKENTDFIINIYMMIVIGIAFEWLESDMQNDYVVEVDKLLTLLEGNIDDAIDRFERKG